MKHKIVTWNLKRNGLAFDPILEAKMLSEEANEFFTAPNLVERIREFADFCFVLEGTKAKFFARKFSDHREAVYGYEHLSELLEWAEAVRTAMRDILAEEVGWDSYYIIISKAIDAVIEANNAKGTEKNADGKVVKGPNYVSPSEVIARILQEASVEDKRP